MANEEIIKKWLAGELSDEEKKAFESSAAFFEIKKLSDALQDFKAPEYDPEKEYQKLSGKILSHKKTISLYDRLKPVLKVAAVLILTLTVGYFSYTYLSSSSIENEWIAEQSEVFLPDASVVMLNAGSKIRFDEKKWEKGRNVELSGEAFFKVNTGSQFNVITHQGEVTVLGTEFDVADWDNYYEVTCYSGRVKVITSQKTVILEPNEAFRIINGHANQYTVSGKSSPAWTEGESSFKSVPLRFVFAELERQYNITLETQNKVDLSQEFTGSFSHKNLNIALESITVPVNLSYEVKDNKVVISVENK